MAVTGSLAVVGAGLSASSTYKQSATDKNNLKYQAQVAANNSIIAQDQASLAEVNGQQQVMSHDLASSALYGSERANLAASGVDLGQGSANDILVSSKFMAKRDANTIQDNALREAWGYKIQKSNYDSNSEALKTAASNIDPKAAAFTSLLGSASKVNSSWNQYAQTTDDATSGQWMKNLFA